MELQLRPEAVAILEVFRARGMKAGGFVAFTDFGPAITWRDGFVADEEVRLGLIQLLEAGYVIEFNRGLELTVDGEATYRGAT